MRKPIIGILGNTYKTQPGLFSSAERMYVNSDYIEAVLNNGGIPMAIPAVAMKANPEDVLAVCDGILVPGGEDLNPWYYGEEPKPQIQTIRPEIDEAWFALGRAAKEMGMPMLGMTQQWPQSRKVMDLVSPAQGTICRSQPQCSSRFIISASSPQVSP